MKKKLITSAVLVVSAGLLVAASILGTLAFLASSSAVSNTFTVGDVGIQMFESKTDENGNDLDGDDRTSDGNSYMLVPNRTYIKDPAITVKAGSVKSYLFVKVKNGIAEIEDPSNTMREQIIDKGWQLVKQNAITGEELFLYIGTDNSPSGEIPENPENLQIKAVGSATEETYEIFDTFSISEGAVVADYGGAKVTLTAFAIQTEGYETFKDGLAGYQHAWNAIVGRFTFESGTVFEVPAQEP